MLEVRLIATFAIECDGKPVTITSRAAQSLFAYLILNSGTAHRREKLAGMFWPDATEEKARAYLRHELWLIRKAIPFKEFLLADDIGIAINSSTDHWLDSEVLEKLKDDASIEELKAGLSAYTGELLPGFYDEWIVLEREHLKAVYEQKMVRLMELLESEQRWNDILEWAERWISFGQGSETAYRYLMIAYDALGDRAKVTATYQRCVQALRELDLEPSEQARALAFKQSSKINIPIPLTSFVGREKELKEVADLLSKSRLVTLTGSGGVGKTRLAIQVTAEVLDGFPDGVWFLDLAPLSDPALVPYVLVNLLGLRQSGEISLTEILINYFRTRTALVIVDNCEHLIESSAQLVHSLLTSCDVLSILATSRETLRVSGEITYRVPSLTVSKSDVPFALDDLASMESVMLFTERAAVITPGFALNLQNAFAVAKICQRLDGIPLAIELAAARTNTLAVEQILMRLDDRFNLLTGGLRTALPRHQTLRAMIEWSYDLLSEKERLLFRRLAVFVGGWTLEAAEEICRGNSLSSGDILDLLTQLFNKSLVSAKREQGQDIRYRILETVRQYAREECWQAGEEEELREQHLRYFTDLAEQAEMTMRGAARKVWMERLEVEHDNLRAALEWSLEQNQSRFEAGLHLAGTLLHFWGRRGYYQEGRQWLERLLTQISLTNARITEPTRAKALYALGALLWLLSDYQGAQVQAEASFRLYQEMEDARGLALTLNLLGRTARAQRDYAHAILLLEQSLAISRKLGDNQGVCDQLFDLAFVWWRHGEYERAEHLFEEILEFSREVGDITRIADITSGLAAVARAQGKYHKAEALNRESLSVFEELGDKFSIAETLQDLGILSWRQGDYAQAREWLERSLEMLREMGIQREAAGSLTILGDVALAQGDVDLARSLYEQAATLTENLGDKLYKARTRQGLAHVSLAEGDFATARLLYEESLARFREINSKVDVSGSLLGLGNVEWGHGNLDVALGFYCESLRIRCELGNPHDIAAILERIATVATAEKQFARAARLFAAAAQMREQVGALLEPIARADHEQVLATIRAELHEEGFDEEWARGRALSIEKVIEFALENDNGQ